MAVSGKIQLRIEVDETQDSNIDLGVGLKKHLVNKTINLTDGTTAGKFDLVWSDIGSTSGTVDIDLYGSLTDTYGATINMVEMVLLYIENLTDGTELTIGADASQAVPLFSDTSDSFTLAGGEFAFFYLASTATGVGPIGAGSSDILQLSASAALQYKIMILGRSA